MRNQSRRNNDLYCGVSQVSNWDTESKSPLCVQVVNQMPKLMHRKCYASIPACSFEYLEEWKKANRWLSIKNEWQTVREMFLLVQPDDVITSLWMKFSDSLCWLSLDDFVSFLNVSSCFPGRRCVDISRTLSYRLGDFPKPCRCRGKVFDRKCVEISRL